MTKVEYYKLGETNVVRVSFNDNGHKIGAERYDRDMESYVIDHNLLSRLEISEDAERITEEEAKKITSREMNI